MPTRRPLFRCGLGLALAAGLLGLAGCGWNPLYADPVAVPENAELRAIRVAPIAERIGQKLAWALRESLNPGGAPIPERYVLQVTLRAVRSDLAILSLGVGTRGKLDVYATYHLDEIKTGKQLTAQTSHFAESFDILANQYSNVVSEEDVRNRAVEELRPEIVSRLAVFMERRGEAAAKP
jgi:LPS-assembly lipoprotein